LDNQVQDEIHYHHDYLIDFEMMVNVLKEFLVEGLPHYSNHSSEHLMAEITTLYSYLVENREKMIVDWVLSMVLTLGSTENENYYLLVVAFD
jgi:hypothetical protein